jgi:hypothetical protein
MSYDLYFTRPAITLEQFEDYFDDRPNYQMSSEQVVYQNEDTGVYFTIDYHDPARPEPDLVGHTAVLCLNYYRPHVFGLEAVEEVAAFIDHFGFSINDPQLDGMGDGPFSREGFLRGWNRGNEAGYSAFFGLPDKDPATKVWTLPASTLEGVWRWNRGRAGLQESLLREDVFVPRVFSVAVADKAATMVVWPDAISAVIPEVDYLMVLRDELAPKAFLRGKKKDQMLVPFDRLRPALQPFLTAAFALPAYRLPSSRTPEAVRDSVRDLKATGLVPGNLPMDQVLDAEIVAKVRSQAV